MNPRPLLVFGEDWGRHPSSTQHLVKHLCRDRPVTWVNSVGLRRPTLTAADIARVAGKARGMISASRCGLDASASLSIVSPRVAPFHELALVRAANRLSLSRQLNFETRPIVWVTLPSAVTLLEAIDPAAVLYYCCDDYGALPGIDRALVRGWEAQLSQRAQSIVATSPALAQQFPREKTVVVPHGVDYAGFTNPAPRAPELPDGAPVAGFYGSLADWLDTELLAAVAGLLPHWTFLLIGRQQTCLKALRARSNIRFLPPVPHHRLPGFAQHWTASIMPFRDNAQIRACNPLKLREYLAAGRPVVSTDFPALEGYRDLIAVAADAGAFADCLEAARREEPCRIAARRRRVAGEGWHIRAAQISNLLDRMEGPTTGAKHMGWKGAREK